MNTNSRTVNTNSEAQQPRLSEELNVRWELWNGDYKDILSPLRADSCDLILTDIPYNISRETSFANMSPEGPQRLGVSMQFGKWDTKELDLQEMSQKFFRVLKPHGTAIVFYDLWKTSHLAEAMREAGFSMLRWVIWEKTNPVPLNMRSTYMSNSREIAVSAAKKGKPTFHGSYHNGVYSLPIPRETRIHPTQKPKDLFSQLVKMHSNEDDLVVDPFCGSGTSAVAALMNGRRFYGGDINADYCKAARDRIENAFPDAKGRTLTLLSGQNSEEEERCEDTEDNGEEEAPLSLWR